MDNAIQRINQWLSETFTDVDDDLLFKTSNGQTFFTAILQHVIERSCNSSCEAFKQFSSAHGPSIAIPTYDYIPHVAREAMALSLRTEYAGVLEGDYERMLHDFKTCGTESAKELLRAFEAEAKVNMSKNCISCSLRAMRFLGTSYKLPTAKTTDAFLYITEAVLIELMIREMGNTPSFRNFYSSCFIDLSTAYGKVKEDFFLSGMPKVGKAKAWVTSNSGCFIRALWSSVGTSSSRAKTLMSEISNWNFDSAYE